MPGQTFSDLSQQLAEVTSQLKQALKQDEPEALQQLEQERRDALESLIGYVRASGSDEEKQQLRGQLEAQIALGGEFETLIRNRQQQLLQELQENRRAGQAINAYQAQEPNNDGL